MATLCRTYIAESAARTAVVRLLAAGVPGADVTVLIGDHDARAAAVTVFPGGVAHARIGGDGPLERMLVAAGLEAGAAAADADALHGGRILVLVTRAGLVAKAALDGAPV